MLALILVICSIVCFFLATFSVPTGRVSIGWLGLALYALASVVRVV